MRHFSHTPAAQAQVLHNVSAGVRAFFVNGFKAEYDGTDPHTGNKRFRAVTNTQQKALSSFRTTKPNSKGTTLEFCIAPSISSVSLLDTAENTIDSASVLTGLASDFSRSLASLALVHTDLKRLSALGSLPISQPNPHTLQVRFPGCDGKTVNTLCDELGIQRGIIKEDPAWDTEEGDRDVGMALLFPWAPSKPASEFSEDVTDMADTSFSRPDPVGTRTLGRTDSLEWHSMLSPSPPFASFAPVEKSLDSFSILAPSHENPWAEHSTSASASFDGLRESDLESNDEYAVGGLELTRTETVRQTQTQAELEQRLPQSFADYEGTEGILRFLEACDGARR